MHAEQVLGDYDQWLERQALAPRTRASYRRWVGELVVEHRAAAGATLHDTLNPSVECKKTLGP